MDKSKLARKFDRQARMYEKQRENKVFGDWREKLLEPAEGDVLELAVGAGANFAYYKSDVEVTAVDISSEMLAKAKRASLAQGIRTDFVLSDVETIAFPENTFDTIVSTLSFCGYDDPVHMFNQLNSWCKPQGKILLLEHGRSSNPMIGAVQQLLNPIQYKFVGCHLK